MTNIIECLKIPKFSHDPYGRGQEMALLHIGWRGKLRRCFWGPIRAPWKWNTFVGNYFHFYAQIDWTICCVHAFLKSCQAVLFFIIKRGPKKTLCKIWLPFSKFMLFCREDWSCSAQEWHTMRYRFLRLLWMAEYPSRHCFWSLASI